MHSLIERRNDFRMKTDGVVELPIPLLAAARQELANKQFRRALERLAKAHESVPEDPELCAVEGLALAEGQYFEELAQWCSSCPKNATDFAEYWSAVGQWFVHQKNYVSALGSLLRAVELDPTSLDDYQRIGFCFAMLGDSDNKNVALDRQHRLAVIQAQSRLLREGDHDRARLGELSRLLLEVGRPLESLQWKKLLNPDSSLAATIDRQRQALVRRADLPELARVYARLQFKVDQIPPPDLAKLDKVVPSGAPVRQDRSTSPISLNPLKEISSQCGFEFEYFNGSTRSNRRPLIHESLGGGIAVLDYDRDGAPDCYLAQGGVGANAGKLIPQTEGQAGRRRTNELHRNVSGQFERVLGTPDADVFQYSIGVTAGDLNQDGFADLVVGNLGSIRIMINQGDGTFREREWSHGGGPSLIPASLGIADLTQDGLPELIVVNYLDDDSAFIRRENENLSPLRYQAAKDRYYQSLPDGTLVAYELELPGQSPAASLGLVVGNLDESNDLEVYVSNDMHPNRLWKWMPRAEASGKQKPHVVHGGWTEIGIGRGVGLDSAGRVNAGMGIAAADFNGDQKIDLHVTNFTEESSNLYIQQTEGQFVYRAPRIGLTSLTYPMLGFGTQPIDVNQDGWMDLAILNGHIEDFSQDGSPYRLPPQLLIAGDGRFTPAGMDTEPKIKNGDDYWQRPALGRSLATLDWNRDGQVDLIAGHLDASYALLENNTEVEANAWMQVELVGVQCERDAIGTTVVVQTDMGQWTQQNIAGDGYLSNNETLLGFGLGRSREIEKVTVHWPSGNEQVFHSLDLNRRYHVIEGIDLDPQF